MGDYTISKNDRVIEFDDPNAFISTAETLLKLGERFLVSIAKSAAAVIERMNEVFARFGLKIAIHADSDPGAMDYVANIAGGGVIGTAVGASGGAAAFLAARAAGFLIPGIGQFLLVGSVIGLILGAATGLAVTRWGLKIRFSPIDGSKLDFEMMPLPEQ
jgi:hypothetical protein